MKHSLRSEIFYFLTQGTFFLLLLGVTVLIILGFIPIKHAWFSQQAVECLESVGADSCSVTLVQVVAWRSIELRGVSFTVVADSVSEYNVVINKMILPINIPQLLLQRKKIIQAVSYSGDVVPSSVLTRPTMIASSLLTLADIFKKGLHGKFDGVWVTIRNKDKIAFLGAGGEVSITTSEKSETAIIAQATFPIVTTYGDGLQNIRCTAKLSVSDGLQIQDLSGKYFDGKIKAKAAITLSDQLSTTYSLNIDKVDMAYWYAVHSGVGEISGSASLQCRGIDVPLRSIDKSLNCSVIISKCKVNGLPLQQSLATSLFIPSLTMLEFEKMSIRLNREKSDSIYLALVGSGDDLSFSSNGWISGSDALQQQIEGNFTEAMIKRFPADIRPIFVVNDENGWRFRCRLYGSYTDPRFELDKETLQRAVGSMFQNMQQDIYQKLME